MFFKALCHELIEKFIFIRLVIHVKNEFIKFLAFFQNLNIFLIINFAMHL